MSDELVFIDETANGGGPERDMPWKVLIVDDDEGVHGATRFAIEHVRVDGRPVEIKSAYSAEEARGYLREHADTALALVDVVMENDRAGLDLVRWVREEQGNQAIRLVLRTGQPGQAPERDVVTDYDIDDYKTKSELTSQKLFTLLHASLRSYNHIRALERNLGGLRRIISASSSLYRAESMTDFASGVLEQMTALLNMAPEALYCETRGVAAATQGADLKIVAASGEFAAFIGEEPSRVLPAEVNTLLDEALASKKSVCRERSCVSYLDARNGSIALVFLGVSRELSEEERELVCMFINNMNLAFCGVVAREGSTGTSGR